MYTHTQSIHASYLLLIKFITCLLLYPVDITHNINSNYYTVFSYADWSIVTSQTYVKFTSFVYKHTVSSDRLHIDTKQW